MPCEYESDPVGPEPLPVEDGCAAPTVDDKLAGRASVSEGEESTSDQSVQVGAGSKLSVASLGQSAHVESGPFGVVGVPTVSVQAGMVWGVSVMAGDDVSPIDQSVQVGVE